MYRQDIDQHTADMEEEQRRQIIQNDRDYLEHSHPLLRKLITYAVYILVIYILLKLLTGR
ncbi:MAG: hypothetical protein IJ225_07980 [Solobacterium sp.]|nr:hypothetical protein [Solobacterium sp.]